MEKYEFVDSTEEQYVIKQDKYFFDVHSKHKEYYGDFGAKNISDNITPTFIEAMTQYNDSSKNNNMLLVGKVQSGKTSNLELFTAIALDNGFNLVVIYGGYDKTLLAQTTNRFTKTFDVPNETNYSDQSPVIFSSDDTDQILGVDNEIIEDLLLANKPIFIISMKRPVALRKINDLLKRINKVNIKSFVIDDEGDQASLNTKKNKEFEGSATYSCIVEMKNLLNNPLYLSVTATPQANIFLNEFSELRPDTIRIIEPGSGYCGADTYHLYDSDLIQVISIDDHKQLEEFTLPFTIREAINHFIIASAVLLKRNKRSSEMIIHSYRENNQQQNIYNLVIAYFEEMKMSIKYEDVESLELLLRNLKQTYSSLFSKNVIEQYSFKDLHAEIKEVITRVYPILKNSGGKTTQSNESLKKHKIYIGGDLLQRGVTFPNLTTTYFTRWAMDNGNMDTNLQRARWFGYRDKYIDICKIFTTDDIAREFTNLSEIESDLWEQFYSVQSGDMKIDQLLIQSENTKQKPTRKNVADYRKVSFKNKWLNQKLAFFDLIQVKKNNSLVLNFVEKFKLINTNAGRLDGKESAQFFNASSEELIRFINELDMVFDFDPFNKETIKSLIGSTKHIPVILMPRFDTEGRERSFYSDNKIHALHQGADNKDKEKVKFLGDRFVIVDKEKINIQIHKIIPLKRIDNQNEKVIEMTQYMFSVYIPKTMTYYSRG